MIISKSIVLAVAAVLSLTSSGLSQEGKDSASKKKTDTSAEHLRNLVQSKPLVWIEVQRLKWDISRLHAEGKYKEAIPIAKKALETCEAAYEEENNLYVGCLNDLAVLYQAVGDYTRAEPLLIKALEIRKKTLGEGHRDLLGSLSNLAALYEETADFSRAEPLYRQALDILKTIPNPDCTLHATLLHNSAALHKALGNYTQAESQYHQALALCEKATGKYSPDYADTLGNLADLYSEIGDYARAVTMHRQALDIRKRILCEGHPDIAISINELAMSHDLMGDYNRAEILYLQASEIWKKAYGEHDPHFAKSLNNLAQLYQYRNDFKRAEPLYQQALLIWKNKLGERHPFYADSLTNLGLMYLNTGDYRQAESTLKMALEIRRETLGVEHLDYTVSVNNLAMLYQAKREYSRAEPLYREALEISQCILWKDHPNVAEILSNLSSLYETIGDYRRAEPLLRQALQIERRVLELTSIAQSEHQQLAMQKSLRRILDAYLSLGLRADLSSEQSYDHVLAWKGSVLSRQRATRLVRNNPELKPQYDRLGRIVSQLATQFYMRPDPQQRKSWHERIEKVIEEKEQIETELANQSAAFRKERDIETLTSEDLQSVLPDTCVLVDILDYNRTDPVGEDTGKLKTERCYVAFIVRRNEPITQIDLGPVRPITTAVDRWRESFGERPDAQEAAREIRRLVWEPLEEYIGDAEIVLISPDSELTRFPLVALPGKKANTMLLEERAVAILPVPQLLPELLAPRQIKDIDSTSLLVVGGVDFDTIPNSTALARTNTSSISRSVVRGDSSIYFPPLPATHGEIETIQELFGAVHREQSVISLLGAAASEAALKEQAPGNRYLHIATHGFFAPGKLVSESNPANVSRASSLTDQLSGDQLDRKFSVYLLQPGLFSGLAMAGANHKPDPTADPMTLSPDDGILTALEVAEMDLRGTELVVLSACDTGLGVFASGEGVLGLQRAFQVAGARNTIVSLWKVNDDATAALMKLFYDKLWRENKPPIDALREAQLAIYRHPEQIENLALHRGPDFSKTVKLVETHRKDTETKYASPRYWAGFVLAGVGEDMGSTVSAD